LVVGGHVIELQPGAQRLIAYTALHNRPIARSVIAGLLWPDTTESRAAASLRSTLWRLRTIGGGSLLGTRNGTIALAPVVDVDVHEVHKRAQDLLSSSDMSACHLEETSAFEIELLPGWWDDWVIAERERLRIMQLAALEQVGLRLLETGQYAKTLDTCLRLTTAEPLRDTTHRLIMRAYLAQGNSALAVRHYRGYCDLLRRELQIPPSPEMERLFMAASSSGRRSDSAGAAVW
jgi:DNA-binding SARP family transcriptional activator